MTMQERRKSLCFILVSEEIPVSYPRMKEHCRSPVPLSSLKPNQTKPNQDALNRSLLPAVYIQGKKGVSRLLFSGDT